MIGRLRGAGSWQHIALRIPIASVAELADARDSKSRARKGMWVRFPPLAPAFNDRISAKDGLARGVSQCFL